MHLYYKVQKLMLFAGRDPLLWDAYKIYGSKYSIGSA